jgi:hypothetical protein
MAINWGDLGAGGLGGAASGASIGTAITPGLGTGIGAGVGGLVGILASLFGGGRREGGPQRLSDPSQQEQSALDYLLKSGQEGLQNPNAGFEPIRQDALNTFKQDIVPYLTNMFDASGSNSASSPVLQSNLSSAGSGLAQRLAAFQAHFAQQNETNSLNRINAGLKPAFNTDYRATEHGTGSNLLGRFLQSKAIPNLIKSGPSIYKQWQENQKPKPTQQAQG